MHHKNRSRGFTLIELLVVIAIIGALSSIVLTVLNGARQKAKVVATASDLKQINMALNFYLSDNGGRYPCFDHNWSDTREIQWAAPYLKWPKDRLGTAPNDQYHWEHGQGGFLFSISINAPGDSNALALDSMVDDGNLGTGRVRGNGVRVEYAGMDQTIPLVDCHI